MKNRERLIRSLFFSQKKIGNFADPTYSFYHVESPVAREIRLCERKSVFSIKGGMQVYVFLRIANVCVKWYIINTKRNTPKVLLGKWGKQLMLDNKSVLK